MATESSIIAAIMRTATLAMASAVFLLLSGVAAAQPASLDACGLLTPAEIKAAVGMEIGKLTLNPTNPAGRSVCHFQVGRGGTGGVVVRTLSDRETPRMILGQNQAYKIKTSDAAGFGPGAFFGVRNDGVVQLNAFKGSTHIIVQLGVTTLSEAEVKAALEKVMATALPRVK
jgi:hypothetical protein